MAKPVAVLGSSWRRALGAWLLGHGYAPLDRPGRGAARVVFTRRSDVGELERWAGLPHPLDDVIWVVEGTIDQSDAVLAARLGVFDSVSLAAPDGFERLGRRLLALEGRPALVAVPSGIIAVSPASRRMIEELGRVADTTMPVLITGETGTGKEEAAHFVHHLSRRKGPFSPINCAAIPNELMESELFGHVRGAFSGATSTVDGKLMLAQNGTVFLDEIDDTPLSTQAKLLRVLEDGRVGRIGEATVKQVDFRIIAATNEDLLELIAQKRFGRDFYERLAIVRIELPPLRERREDIPLLVDHFVALFDRRHGRPPKRRAVCPRALSVLMDHSWPGNIRQLRNVIFQALVYAHDSEEILLADLRPLLAQPTRGAARSPGELATRLSRGDFNLRAAIHQLERDALAAALAAAHGNAAHAARLLGEVGRGKSRDPGATVRAMQRRLGL